MNRDFDWRDLARALAAAGGGQVQARLPLRELTTIRIGGPAGAVCRVENVDQARKFQAEAHRRDLPLTCLGGGSNVLGDDAGFAGVVLHVATEDYGIRGDTVIAGAGLAFDDLIARTLGDGLVGLEFASGIPGTLGGAVVGNAGCYGHEICESVREATVLQPDGRLETLGAADFRFAYRTSALKGSGAIVLRVVLGLRRGDAAAAGERRAELIADRRRKHPWDEPCAGSWFQNLPPLVPGGRRRAAGQLLEQVGAKSMREGDAAVSEKHANIIVNRGHATSAQVLRLADRMRHAVHDRFGVLLEPEVRHLTANPSGG